MVCAGGGCFELPGRLGTGALPSWGYNYGCDLAKGLEKRWDVVIQDETRVAVRGVGVGKRLEAAAGVRLPAQLAAMAVARQPAAAKFAAQNRYISKIEDKKAK